MTSPALPLTTLQIGKGWFPEESGGLDRYYFDLVRHLPATGIVVQGLVTGSDRVARESGGVVRAFAPTNSSLPIRWRAVQRDARQQLAADPDMLCIGHFALYSAPCLDLVRGRPFVVHFQGPWAAESRAEGAGRIATWSKAMLEHRVYAQATRCLVLSRAFGRILEEEYRVPAERIVVLPGGVECSQWESTTSRRDARLRLGWPTDRPIVLVVRRLVRRMGLENLIASVDQIRKAVPEALILIAGSGPLAAELTARRDASNVATHLQFLGRVPDGLLPLIYRAADLSVVPSVSLEGFGLVVVESLAAGTPVLVTAVGGLPETVEGLSADCVIDEPGSQALARAIGEALLGRRPMPAPEVCSEFARRRFDWSSVAPRVGDAYRSAVQ